MNETGDSQSMRAVIALTAINKKTNEIQSVSFSEAALVELKYTNYINTRPTGSMRITMNSDTGLVPISQSFGEIDLHWVYRGRNVATKLHIYVLSVTQGSAKPEGEMIGYNITFACGRAQLPEKENSEATLTGAISGPSHEKLAGIFGMYGFNVTNKLGTSNEIKQKCTDTMASQYINETMWEILQDIVETSYIEDDFEFWAYDESANGFVVNTKNASMQKPMDFIAHDTMTSGSPSEFISEGVDDTEKNTYGIWHYMNAMFSDVAGQNLPGVIRPISFANVTRLTGVPAFLDATSPIYTMNQPGADHAKLNEKMGTITIAPYGNGAKQRWHNPNEMHDNYDIAIEQRNRIIASLGSEMFVVFNNSLGPIVGSSIVMVDFIEGNYRLTYSATDIKTYFVMGKEFTYARSTVTPNGGKTTSEEFSAMVTIDCRRDDTQTEDMKNADTVIKIIGDHLKAQAETKP
jgi:hypothetical protein